LNYRRFAPAASAALVPPFSTSLTTRKLGTGKLAELQWKLQKRPLQQDVQGRDAPTKEGSPENRQ
jgi:hypothetical protein